MPLTVRNLPMDLTRGKCCHHNSEFNIFQIGFNLVDNKDRHKSLVKFDFGLNRVVHSGVICAGLLENLPIDLTWGKCCHHDSDFNFFQISFNLAHNQQRH